MAGYIVLEGGAEFGGLMSEPDRRAIELAGGLNAPISIIPTAAAPANNHRRAGNNGVNWFHRLGATHVEVLSLIDRPSANNPRIAAALRQSRLIYLLGGFTGYLGETLAGSASLQAMQEAYQNGAVIAGSSAGAMVLCQYYYDPARHSVVEGFDFVPNACVLPHHNTFGKDWAGPLSQLLPEVVLLGIDEHTGMIDTAPVGRKTGWCVYGQGSVTVYHHGEATVYHKSEVFPRAFR
jgi:cyanophycinase